MVWTDCKGLMARLNQLILNMISQHYKNVVICAEIAAYLLHKLKGEMRVPCRF